MEELFTFGARWCVQVSLDPGNMHLFWYVSQLYHQRSQGDRKYRQKKRKHPTTKQKKCILLPRSDGRKSRAQTDGLAAL